MQLLVDRLKRVVECQNTCVLIVITSCHHSIDMNIHCGCLAGHLSGQG